MSESASKRVYRIQGFTCSGCAATFEKNVKALPRVEHAQVNFGASKLTVYGDVSVEELEKAGAFELLKVYPEKQRVSENQEPFWKRKNTIRTAVSAALLLIGWLNGMQTGASHMLSVAAYAASIIVGGYPLFIKGFRNVVRLQFDMNTLMTAAIIGAAAIGEWAEGATVVILFAISEALESYSMDRARRSIRSLMEIAPKEATVRRNNKEIRIDVEDIRVNDIVIVKPGQKIAVDGIIIQGSSAVNQAPITGESVPVTKNIGDEVFAGTLNEEGLLEIEVTKTADDSTIAKIIHLVEEAQAERAPSQAFVDRFAKVYTPLIMLIALGVAVVPPLLFDAGWSEWIYRGLAVLVVGCPCALIVSTPIAIVTAIGNAAKQGVLIKGGLHLEEAGSVSVVAFDKTGTLTKGVPEVTDFITFGDYTEEECLVIASTIEKGSQHPIAAAIVRKAVQHGSDIHAVEGFTSITGQGAKGKVNGSTYYIGSPRLFEDLLPGRLEERIVRNVIDLQAQGKTTVLLGKDNNVLALFAVADDARDMSKGTIAELHNLGIQNTIMLTGDNEGAANTIANRIGLSNVHAELLPQDKLEIIKRLQQQYGKVAMVGDGVNDAPAMAAANIGIAMGAAGTDAALETADIALMADDLSKLPFTVKLSRKALAVIKQNISFSLLIKAVALFLVVPGWLTLWLAVFADMGATLIVTLNALRLLKVKE